jgi:hypothetical protein
LPSQQVKKPEVSTSEGSPTKGLTNRVSATNESGSVASIRRTSLTKALGFASASEVLVSPSYNQHPVSTRRGLGSTPSTITQLNLNHNVLTGEALDIIAQMMSTNRTLTELNLKGNRINSANKKVVISFFFLLACRVI